MRIVIDLQGVQNGSRQRGIGRYSLALAQAVIRNKGVHEVIIVLNGLFPETIEPIRAAFNGLLPQDKIRVWQATGPVYHLDPANKWRRKAAELNREAFLANLKPDIVCVTSLFEGTDDNTATSVGLFSRAIPTAVIMYDLIPLINRQEYLTAPTVAAWYDDKLEHIKKADLLLAISESSRQEAIVHLGMEPDSVVNISAAVDDIFKPVYMSKADENKLRGHFGLAHPFLMYSGATDHRKNHLRLIKAFSLLPLELRDQYQLAFVGRMPKDHQEKFEAYAESCGLTPADLIITGGVTDIDMVRLYNLCELFVFPSWHEGFGLPALEAMCCGAPVIGANTTSVPEVIGRADALFDPFDEESMAQKIKDVLTNDDLRADLAKHNLQQAKLFSWNESAHRAIAAFERFHVKRQIPKPLSLLGRRLKLAYVSPLPPKRNGIYDCSAEFINQLSRYYDVDVITEQDSNSMNCARRHFAVFTVDWFINNAHRYHRVVYHFGNSQPHRRMFDLQLQLPGIIVLHDFFLGPIIAQMDGVNGHFWARTLYQAHGYLAVQERFHANDVWSVAKKYPCNQPIIENSVGVIVHSEHERQLAGIWLGKAFAQKLAVVPLHRNPETAEERIDACQALQYVQAIEKHYAEAIGNKDNLINAIANVEDAPDDDSEWLGVSQALSQNYPASSERQFLVDISALVHYDLKSGIQRVVRSILSKLLANPPQGFRVEPVYAYNDQLGYRYRYAREFTMRFIDCPDQVLWDEPIEVNNGDIFLGLDLNHHAIRQNEYYAQLRRVGCHVYFVVYDLLPCLMPETCDTGVPELHKNWLKLVAQNDGAICISHAVAEEMAHWLSLYCSSRLRPFKLGWFHLGADIAESLPSTGIPEDADIVMNALNRRITFVIVGTVEPRKGQTQVLEAFEVLWSQGEDVNLLIVGKQGWHVEMLIQRFRDHTELNRRLFWLEGISDEYLEKIYASSSCLIAASYGEGFGLPLIEAAQHKLPIIARDIPVFSEVAGKHAYYFHGLEATDLANAVKAWLELEISGKAPQSDGIPWLTWSQSTQQLLDVVLNGKWIDWMPDGVHRYLGSDDRLLAVVGETNGTHRKTTGVAGWLCYGPYLQLPAGRYQARLYGQVTHPGIPKAFADIVITNNGEIQVLSFQALAVSREPTLIASMDIYLPSPVVNIEFRVWVAMDSELNISKLEIVPEARF